MGKTYCSAKNTFPTQNSLVYGQKSCLKWPILTNLLCFGLFYPKIGLLSKFGGGLDFRSHLELWKSIKWPFLVGVAWNLIYGDHKILHEKKFPQKSFFWAREGSKSKKVKIFGNKHEKCHFSHKMPKKWEKHIFLH